MYNVAVGLEHVDFFDGLNGLDVELLEGLLKLLVICSAALVHLLNLSTDSTLSARG